MAKPIGVPLDLAEEQCVKSALTSDGLYLLQSGITAQGYFEESGRWLQKAQLVGIGSDGQALDWTDYSSGRTTMLDREVRTAPTDELIQEIAARMIEENIKKGWEEVV